MNVLKNAYLALSEFIEMQNAEGIAINGNVE